MSSIWFRCIRSIPLNYTESCLGTRKFILCDRNFFLVNKTSSIYTTYSNNNDRENPFKRTFRIISQDFKSLKDSFISSDKFVKPYHFPNYCDILIIGGGVMGFSIAYWLQERVMDALKIVVVEKDPSVKFYSNKYIEYLKSTTALSAGGIRQQFSLKENIELSLYSAEFLRNLKLHLGIEGQEPPDINFNPTGYVFLASEKSAQIVIDNVNLQNSLGAKVELLTLEKLKEKFPWMNTDGVAIASHGLENEGWFDPWSLLQAFKRKALFLGVDHVVGEVTKFKFEENSLVINDPVNCDRPNGVIVSLPDGTEKSISFSICVIAAGAMSGEVSKLAGIGCGPGILSAPLPVEPRKRFVHVVHCPEGPGFKCPFLIDYTGAYVRRDGINGNYICGMSPLDEEEPSVDNLDVEGNFFEDRVWPIIAHRVPAFEKCKIKNCWAGFYDYNKFDENAFIGSHPGYPNLFFATGFSGHGIQQAPAVGRAVMEKLIDGEYKTIDLSRFGFKRYIDDKPLYESNIV